MSIGRGCEQDRQADGSDLVGEHDGCLEFHESNVVFDHYFIVAFVLEFKNLKINRFFKSRILKQIYLWLFSVLVFFFCFVFVFICLEDLRDTNEFLSASKSLRVCAQVCFYVTTK